MQIGVLGINHKSADLGLRERISKAMNKYFGIFCYNFPFVLITTCNRTEIYFSSEDLAVTHSFLFGVLRNEINFEFEHKIYSYFGVDCFLHLAKVTAGLDSAILGETEIQGQVKQSYETACKARALSKELHFLFQKSLKIGKEVRSKSQQISTPLEDLVYHAAKKFFIDLNLRKILIVGLSEINLKILKKFENFDVTISNRTESKTQGFGKKTLPFSTHHLFVLDYDVIIYGTKAQDFLLTELPYFPLERKLIIDASVPRNVDPKIASSLVTLLNIDQITESTHGSKESHLMPLLAEVEKQIALFNKREALQILVGA